MSRLKQHPNVGFTFGAAVLDRGPRALVRLDMLTFRVSDLSQFPALTPQVPGRLETLIPGTVLTKNTGSNRRKGCVRYIDRGHGSGDTGHVVGRQYLEGLMDGR